MTDKSSETRGNKPSLTPSSVQDNLGWFIVISCGTLSGHLYLNKLAESKKTLGKCILVKGTWYTPLDFEALAGKKGRKWRQTLMHLGKPLSDYCLSCPGPQVTLHSQPLPTAEVSLPTTSFVVIF